LSLRDNAGAWLPGGSIPGATTQQNSQCSINFATSSAVLSGNNLTLNVAVTFKSAYSGNKNIYLYAATVGGAITDWQQRGTWTIPAPASQITAVAQYDNAVLVSSNIPQHADTVYSNTDLAVGCNFSIGPFVSDYSCAATALKFNVQSQIAGRAVQRAVLRLYPYILPADIGTTYRLAAFTTDWNPATLTYNNVFTMNLWVAGQSQVTPPVTTAFPLEFDVTTIVRNWASGLWGNYGLFIDDTADTFPPLTLLRSTFFESVEYNTGTARRPTLVIDLQ
jgi:hypothetical protein